jgi:hypothetical protein
LYLADQTPPLDPGRGGHEDLDGLLQPRRRISGRLLVEKNQTLVAFEENQKVDGNTSQVYVEKAVPSGLDSVWKKRSVIFFASIFILFATIACLLFLSASDTIPVLRVVVFHLCKCALLTINNVSV